jgi:glycosyltransferase involved in cell wall biosynthesis
VGATVLPWSLESERDHLSRFDLGIMPLPDNRWTRGKGGYKLLQYMALGLPSVASPVGVNQEIIADGVNGYLARDEGEWVGRLAELVADAEKRRALGATARQLAEERYSVRAATPRLLEILRRAARAPQAAPVAGGVGSP